MSEKRHGFKECIEGLYEDIDIVAGEVNQIKKREKQLQIDLAVYFVVIIATNTIILYLLINI